VPSGKMTSGKCKEEVAESTEDEDDNDNVDLMEDTKLLLLLFSVLL
jgi:hypothetical protein